jgi:hypothetical protein
MEVKVLRVAAKSFVGIFPTNQNQGNGEKYSPLHKYGITPRRSIRLRVFFIWIFRLAKIEKMT